MRLPRSWSGVLFVTFLVMAICAIVSLAMTIMHFGLSDGLLHRWGRALGVSFLVAWPTASIVAPMVRRLVDWLTK